ncbi:ABC-three component system protein [Vibrio amylolyticus]|uniref:ABC-three component system protein n=1 Tax=Vibrio amylolyticus TaxID=2847292 RepID=UPI00355402E1
MSRRQPTHNEKQELFQEVNGVCPMPFCKAPLSETVNSSLFNRYDVAHIYPSSPKPHEVILLQNEVRLHSDPENLDNMIALCKPCHGKFDNPRTVQGYRDMCALKIQLKKKNNITRKHHSVCLENEILTVITGLSNLSQQQLQSAGQLSHAPKKVDDKVKGDSSIGVILKDNIKSNVISYYNVIKKQFEGIDKVEPYKSEVIYSQVKTISAKLKSEGLTKAEIYNELILWIKNSTNAQDDTAIRIIASFFVQNCEALE